MFIHELCASWISSPFWQKSFLIENQATIEKIRKAGIQEAWIDTAKGCDVLVTTPLISKARELWPDAQFHFLGYRGKLEMLHGNPNITEIIETSDRPSLGEYLTLFNRLFQRYDLAIVTQPSDRAYLYGLVAAFRGGYGARGRILSAGRLALKREVVPRLLGATLTSSALKIS